MTNENVFVDFYHLFLLIVFIDTKTWLFCWKSPLFQSNNHKPDSSNPMTEL